MTSLDDRPDDHFTTFSPEGEPGIFLKFLVAFLAIGSVLGKILMAIVELPFTVCGALLSIWQEDV